MIKVTAKIVVVIIFKRQTVVNVSAMIEWFWHFMCMCYLVGGTTIGYYYHAWRNRKKRTGTGRWDYQDRHLP